MLQKEIIKMAAVAYLGCFTWHIQSLLIPKSPFINLIYKLLLDFMLCIRFDFHLLAFNKFKNRSRVQESHVNSYSLTI